MERFEWSTEFDIKMMQKYKEIKDNQTANYLRMQEKYKDERKLSLSYLEKVLLDNVYVLVEDGFNIVPLWESEGVLKGHRFIIGKTKYDFIGVHYFDLRNLSNNIEYSGPFEGPDFYRIKDTKYR